MPDPEFEEDMVGLRHRGDASEPFLVRRGQLRQIRGDPGIGRVKPAGPRDRLAIGSIEPPTREGPVASRDEARQLDREVTREAFFDRRPRMDGIRSLVDREFAQDRTTTGIS